MIDNLTEAIAHERQEAENYTITSNALYEKKYKISLNCQELADYHEQLVSWLTELQERRDADRWIPVSERLPEDYTKVLITNEYGIVTCVTWSAWYQNEYKDAKKEYKAIAWKPVPKRYESENK